MISINTDISDLILLNSLNDSSLGIGKTIERLSSGFKLNHASDNAAGINIVNTLTTKINSLLQIQDNTQDGISLLSTAQGALENIQDKLSRLRELAVQAANGTYGDRSLSALQEEADAIIEQIKQIRENTEFNGMKLFYTPNENSIVTTAVNNLASAAKVSSSTMTTYSSSTMTPALMSVQTYSSPTTYANDTITGAVDLSGSETKTITIDGVSYEIKNKLSTAQSLSYSKDTSTGELTFYCSNVQIKGESTKSHNLIIEGSYNTVYGGNLADNIKILTTNLVSNYIYGQGGDDTLETRSSSTNHLYGEDGNDRIIANYTSTYAVIYGGAGDDIIDINNGTVYGQGGNDIISSYYAGSLYGGDDDDTFYLYGTSATKVDGGSGTNTVAVNKGSSNIMINVDGANAFSVDFQGLETKDVLINGINYTIKNKGGSASSFVYTIGDDGSWTIESLTSNFKVEGDKSKAHNVYIKGSSIDFYGGDLDDTVTVMSGANNAVVYGGKGNDTLVSEYYYSKLYGEDGDDILIQKTGYYNYLSGGNGNDTFQISGGTQSILDGGEGNDNFTVSSSVSDIAINGGTGTNTLSNSSSGKSLLSGFGEGIDNAYALNFAASETKTLNINGIEYTIKNTSIPTTLLYTYSDITGEITFYARNFNITGDITKQHNISIYGYSNNLYTGNLEDTVNIYGGGGAVYTYGGDDNINNYGGMTVYGGDGDDKIYINTGSACNVYGQEGNDIITIDKIASSGLINGENGDDTFNINDDCRITDTGGNNIYNVNTSNATVNGGSGNDTFYVIGSNNNIYAGGGDDYIVIDGENNFIDGGTGTNYYIDNSTGSTSNINSAPDPNSGMILFSLQDEIKTFTIGGKTYTVKNNFSGANQLKYSYNSNTGTVTLEGDNLLIDSDINQANVINLRGNNNTVNGSNLVDKITIENGSNNVINGLGGNDILIMNSANNSLYGGDGNDTITLNAATDKEVSGGNGSDTLNILVGNNTNVSAGSGNDIINVSSNDNIIDAGEGNNKINVSKDFNTITAGDGDNTIVVTGQSNVISAGMGDNSVGIEGNLNEINVENAFGDINIYGNNNTVTNISGENSVKISGNGNSYTTESGDKDITISGNSNNIQTGSGTDSITVRGDKNTVLSGDGDDTFMVGKGDNNSFDGEGGRNTIVDNGKYTNFNNTIDITPRPFELDIKVGIGSGDSKIISTSISFNLYDFAVDFSTQESALESIDLIDEMMDTVSNELLKIGTSINRLELALDEQEIKLENMISSRSTLRDADVADESSNLIRFQILQQASATLISSSRNVRANNILGLLNSMS